MKFRIFIPASVPDSFDTTLTVDAADWLSALRAAFARLGEPLHRGLLCRMEADRSLRISSPNGQRMVTLQPLEPTDEDTHDPTALHDTLDVGPEQRKALLKKKRAVDGDAASRILSERRTPSGHFPSIQLMQWPEEVLIDQVMERVQWVYEDERRFTDVADHFLALALDMIPATFGVVLFPGLQGRSLHLAAARGDARPALAQRSVPLDQGLVGFCVRESVSLAVGEVGDDPALAPALWPWPDRAVRSVLCVPIHFEDQVFGAIELVNRRHQHAFNFADQAMLNHICQQFGQYIMLNS